MWISNVLILVVEEDGLVLEGSSRKEVANPVLILIVVEDGLVQDDYTITEDQIKS